MKKLLSWILCIVLVLTCSAGLAESAPVTVIDFEDGNYAFLGIDTSAGNADASELSIVEYNGSMALRVDVKNNVPYIALNIEGLLGENIGKLRSISFDIGTELGSNGKFYSQSGKVYTITGSDEVKTGYEWSIYLKTKNPKTATVKLNSDFQFTPGQGERLLITKETDAFLSSGKFEGEEGRDIYIDNIRFLDENGNELPLDLTAVWTAPVVEFDLSNLSLVTGTVNLEGMSVEGGAWSQAGVSMTDEFRAALVPGSVIEIDFESDAGDVWLVFPDAAVGWSRVQMMTATTNISHTTAQITFEQCAAILGEDTAAWGDRLQCESSGNWKVFSVQAGMKGSRIAVSGAVAFEGFSCSAGAWTQTGFPFTEEILEALQPGTALGIEFESESGDMWIVLPDAAAGWTRVQMMSSTVIGDKAYITYEQIVEAVGEDKAAWGERLQCESSGEWSVYAVKAGKVNTLVGVKDAVAFEGFSVSGGAWSQVGLEMTDAVKAALVPGCVVSISYESEANDMWLVFPDAVAGWSRVEMMNADTDGSVAQITYEELVAVLGENVADWGARMQCESSGAWTVYGITVAQPQ